MARILTAVAPDAEARIRRILVGHELRFVLDLVAARTALAAHKFQLVVVGARFDESRMFELLDYIRKDAKNHGIPIIAAIIAPVTMSEGTVSGLEHTTKLLGASVFVNLNDFGDDETGNSRLRIMVEALLLPPQVVPAVARQLPRA